ncbi:AraC-like DNA-binding protein [Mucilaginibacter lappiensis]|uniref:AraC-like DNA-binding protein n=1 Tax=Mucilaginibacter lappiensis TaxID=354630 RepID=A0ABR6PDA3_9SPHI|nr:helix-turn-helix transcriptional regulator [Mucilaginibacter lappiensis]MBB6107691.1 AraC-like DNA-binding protein [Mucilaginibacter lappiensis]
MTDNIGAGIAIERISFHDLRTLDNSTLDSFEESKLAHREDRHSFFLLENGIVHMEIDFQKYEIKSPSVVYMHPDQVHRMIGFENITISSWALNNENLNPGHLQLLEDIAPAKPLVLNAATFSIISEAVSLCIKFSERKKDKLYHLFLIDSCNALVALVASQYLELAESTGTLSRFELIAKCFKSALERDFITVKRPAAYAQSLNISTPYLNECVKNATGYSVSYHIQQRIVLEAKRLLYHSDKSVKEISAELGYEDYSYFSKLFTKTTGMTPLTFRHKNLD